MTAANGGSALAAGGSDDLITDCPEDAEITCTAECAECDFEVVMEGVLSELGPTSRMVEHLLRDHFDATHKETP